MKKTTRPPSRNVLDVLPELAAMAKTTVRLHPRLGEVPELGASKIGGTFLWPRDEPWPNCTESGAPDWWGANISPPYPWRGPQGPHGPLVPVLQLRKDDFPEVEFYPDTDLFQLLWCPIDHSERIPKPFVFWRKASGVVDVRTMPPPEPELNEDFHYLPNECRVFPERVQEFPSISDLSEEWIRRIEEWDWPAEPDVEFDEALAADNAVQLYEWELSVCPGSKVGGHVHWVQDDATPVCQCGHRMDHLLTLTDTEWDAGTFARWMPIEDSWDRTSCESAIGFGYLSGWLYFFVCRHCDKWPIRTVFQR